MFEALKISIADRLNSIAARMVKDPYSLAAERVPHYGRTLSGVRMTPDSAVTISTVWACLRFVSQTVAVLPWHAMRDGNNGAEIAYSHPVDYLIARRPNPEWSSFQFRETLTHWALRWGNGCAEIEPDQAGRPFNLWPIHPERVSPCRAIEDMEDVYGEPIRVGDLYYEIGYGGASNVVLSRSRMFHIRGFGEGPWGVNVLNYAAESLGWAKATQLFGASFFGNGANVSAVIMNKRALSPEAMKRQRKQFDDLYRGPRNANKLAVLDADADMKILGLDAEKAQLVAVNIALVSEICRWFGVPPHKVMELSRATFSNIEHQAIEVVVDSIAPWAKRFEDEADYKLFGAQNRNGLYTKMNMRGLLRGDTTARIAYYDGMVKIGAYSPNRVLELEDENTIGPDGDIHVMQNQNVTLEQIAAGVGIPVSPSAPSAGPPADPETDQGPLASVTQFDLDSLTILARDAKAPAHV